MHTPTRNDFRSLDTYLLIEAAIKEGFSIEIPYDDKRNFAVLTNKDTGKIDYIHNELISSRLTTFAFRACKYKASTKKFLFDAGISVPQGGVFKNEAADDILEAFSKMTPPIVIKPSFGTHGNGVIMNIHSTEDVMTALEQLTDVEAQSLILEEQIDGTEYRVLATTERLLAVANREPAHIIGDGTHTVMELATLKNNDPQRQENPTLKDVPCDAIAQKLLQDNDMSLETIPQKDKVVYLRTNSNISAGGDSIDYTDKIHPYLRELAPKIVRAIPGLPYAGIDFITKDISKDPREIGYHVIELNASPMLSIHHYPWAGTPRDVAKGLIHDALL